MQVSAIFCNHPNYMQNSVKMSVRNNKNLNQKDSFCPSFKGYEKELQKAVRTILKNDNLAEETFTCLIKEVTTSPDMIKSSEYYEIKDLYDRRGFRGLLYELWKSKPIESLKKFLNNDTVVLASDNKKPLFEIIHFEGLGFSKNAPNDVKVAFLNPKNKTSIQYGLNKKGELEIWQTGEGQTVITEFHLTSGNRKKVVEQWINCPPETTYYNADGSKSFWKNLFRGGPAIAPQ